MSRASLPIQGAVAAATALVLALSTLVGSAGLPGSAVLGTLVLLAQFLLTATVLSLLDAPARGLTTLFGSVVAVAADLSVLVGNPEGDVGRLAGVVGLALVAVLLLQLARRERSAVTESLTDTLLIVVLVCASACLLAVRQRADGDKALLVAFCATAAAVLVGRLADRLRPRPQLRSTLDRGWPGLLLALAAGALIGGAIGAIRGLTAGPAGLLALAAAATVCVADLTVETSGAAVTAGGQRRRVAALGPVAALFPYVLLGPVVLVVARLTLP